VEKNSTVASYQTASSIDKNADFFDHNESYMRAQEELEIYRLIRLAVTREIRGVTSLLDVGNGGFFNYPTENIPQVTACDLMLKDEQKADNIQFRHGSILDLPFEDNSFNCVLEQNVLHHVVGNSVKANKQNLTRALSECVRVLKPGGKLLLIESTVPEWFYTLVEHPLYTLLVHIWPFRHPLTFQFSREVIVGEMNKLPVRIDEQAIIPRGKWVLQYGLTVPTFLTPIQALKLVFIKQ
jgi:ubiquinone/menaquinone biosynthesis C-methylase UbiE